MKKSSPRGAVMVKPDSLRAYVEHYDLTIAAKDLGLSPTAISANLADDRCRVVTELAARHLLAEADPAPEAPPPTLVAGMVEADKVGKLVEYARFIGVRLVEVAGLPK